MSEEITNSEIEDFWDISQQLDQFFKERDANFPSRSPENSEKLQELLSIFVSRTNKYAKEKSYDSTLINEEIADSVIDNCFFLCGYMKCGTTLLLELLDSHPELIVLPGDSWFKGRRFLDGDQSADRYAQNFRDKWLARIVNPTGQSPFWLFGKQAEPYIEFISHHARWMEIVNDPGRGHLLSTVLAYYSANPAKPRNPKAWVEKTPGNEFEVERILHYFPQARFLHIVRDPRENFGSVKRLYQTRNWDWNPMETAKKIAESCRLSKENQDRLGKDRYCVLHYEHLVNNPQLALENICQYMDISWDDALLKPTINGVPAQSNTMYSDRMVTGSITSTRQDKWMKTLNDWEKRAILCADKDACIAGYDWNVSLKDRAIHVYDKLLHRIRSLRGKEAGDE